MIAQISTEERHLEACRASSLMTTIVLTNKTPLINSTTWLSILAAISKLTIQVEAKWSYQQLSSKLDLSHSVTLYWVVSTRTIMEISAAIMTEIISMSWCKATLRRHRCSSWNLASYNLSHLMLEAKREPILGSPLILWLLRTKIIKGDQHLLTKTRSIPTNSSWEAARLAKIVTRLLCTTYRRKLILIALVLKALSIRTSHPLL